MKNNIHVIIILMMMFSPIVYDIIRLIIRIRLGKTSFTVLRKYLIRFLAIVFIFITMILTLNHTNYLNYESPISYEEINRISFKNFRGLEFFRKQLKGNPKFAYIVTSIEYEVRDDIIYVESFFYPSRSYVYNRDAYSQKLLDHELYHFKITELHARRIREEISNSQSHDKIVIDEIIKKILKEERKFQSKYDFDTYHSYVRKEQVKYQKEIDSLITSLEKYKNPSIVNNEN